jgi:hypothetical protein
LFVNTSSTLLLETYFFFAVAFFAGVALVVFVAIDALALDGG